ncbi:MAG: hypothetical protein AB7G75_26725 [Candidatus Binatia bacterium]
MAQITIEVPDELAERLAPVRDRLPEVLAHGLKQLSPVPTDVYRTILDFLTSNPSPQAILDFKFNQAVQEHISELLDKNRANELTAEESAELDSYERLNRFVRKFKIQAMKDVQATA